MRNQVTPMDAHLDRVQNAEAFMLHDYVTSNPKGPNFQNITPGSPMTKTGQIIEVSGRSFLVRWPGGSEAYYSPIDLIKV